jgi:hypothetical protein
MSSRSTALALVSLLVPAAAGAIELPVPEALLWAVPSITTTRAGLPEAPLPRVEPSRDKAAVARLAWLDPSGVARGFEGIAQPEVTRLLAEMGVASTWRKADPGELAQPGEVRVIFLNLPGGHTTGMPVLGATPMKADETPHVWIHVPSVGEAVGFQRYVPGALLELSDERRMGIGLARVVAHEVVHALVPTLPHGKGLMAPRLDRRMLTAPGLNVDARLGAAVREALAGATGAAPDAQAIVAAGASREREEAKR